MAVTNTEVYRPFAGRTTERNRRFWPLAVSGIRIGVKKKLPLLLIFIPPGIATIVHCFMVYAAFAASGQMPRPTNPTELIAASIASQLLEVRGIIGTFNEVTTFFSLLVMAWWGAGLISEDKRLGAHLLYFSRPIRRSDYLLGKFGTVAFFGACTSFLPVMIICMVAAFTSPEWSFLKEQSDTIAYSIGFASIWISLVSSIVLSISSLTPRKTFALIGIVAAFFLTSAPIEILIEVSDDNWWGVFSPFRCMEELSWWFFRSRDMAEDWVEVQPYFIAVIVMNILSWTLVAWRVRRLEVVA